MSKAKQPSTFVLTKEQATSGRKWLLLDASGKTLGRFASEVAKVLIGKHKPSYTPNVDDGDGVVVINASKIKVTGSKAAQKKYRYYTGAVGGLREVPYEVMIARRPEFIVEHAVRGMMPKSRLGRAQLKKLRVFAGQEHTMDAQQPVVVNI